MFNVLKKLLCQVFTYLPTSCYFSIQSWSGFMWCCHFNSVAISKVWISQVYFIVQGPQSVLVHPWGGVIPVDFHVDNPLGGIVQVVQAYHISLFNMESLVRVYRHLLNYKQPTVNKLRKTLRCIKVQVNFDTKSCKNLAHSLN